MDKKITYTDAPSYVTAALKDLAESIAPISHIRTENSNPDELIRCLNNAKRNLDYAIHDLCASSREFTEEEANLARSFHTFLRKGFVDDPAGDIAYELIRHSMGSLAYSQFIKTFQSNNGLGKLSDVLKNAAYNSSNYTWGDYLMRNALFCLADRKGLNSAWKYWHTQYL